MDAIEPQNMKRRGWWRVQFSLRSLVLFVLLLGSAGTLWWNWGPWVPAFSIVEDGAIQQVGFTPDNRWVFTYKIDEKRVEVGKGSFEFISQKYAISFYDSETGKHIKTINGEINKYCPLISFSPAGKFILLSDGGVSVPWSTRYDEVKAIVEIASEKRTLIELPNFNFDFISKNDVFALIEKGSKWIRLSDGKTMGVVPPSKEVVTTKFSNDEKWTIVLEESKNLYIFDAQTGLLEKSVSVADCGEEMTASQSDNYIALGGVGSHGEKIIKVLEIPSGKTVNEFRGELLNWSSNYFSTNGKLVAEMENSTIVYDVLTKRSFSLERREFETFETFSPSGNRILRSSPWSAFDSETGAKLWEVPTDSSNERGRFSIDGELLRLQDHPNDIISARTGTLIWRLDLKRFPNDTIQEFSTRKNADEELKFITSTGEEYSHTAKRATVWKQVRPVAWYGIAWLPEFWLTILIGVGWVWSVVKKG